MEHHFQDRSSGKFPGAWNIGKGSPVLPDRMFQRGISCSISSKSFLTPVSRLGGRFSENETDLFKWKTRFEDEINHS